MTAMLRKLWFYFRKLFMDDMEIGEKVMVYYPKEDEYVVVEVSSVKAKTFSAKFPHGEPSCIDTWKYGQQFDNDIYYDIKARTPIDRTDAVRKMSK